jgi:anti-anti-sigma regulatory factor
MFKLVDGLCIIKPESTFTIYDVEHFVHQIKEKLTDIRVFQLDLGQVTEFDTAGWQSLVSLQKYITSENIPLEIVDISQAVSRIINLFGMPDQFQQMTYMTGNDYEA